MLVLCLEAPEQQAGNVLMSPCGATMWPQYQPTL